LGLSGGRRLQAAVRSEFLTLYFRVRVELLQAVEQLQRFGAQRPVDRLVVLPRELAGTQVELGIPDLPVLRLACGFELGAVVGGLALGGLVRGEPLPGAVA